MANKKRIFITGASSELMQRFISLVDTEKYDITGLTRNLENKEKSVVKWVKGDIQDTDQIEGYIKRCHIIIHGAAITHSFDKNQYYDINWKATQRLVNLAKRHNIEKFIFISSRAAEPKSGAYGKSKLLAEMYIEMHLNKWIIFRPAEVYGGSKNEGITKLINQSMENKYVMCPSNLPSKIFPVHIYDTAWVMHDYIFNKDINNETVIINGHSGYSYKELIQQIGNIAHKKIKIVSIPRKIMFAIKKLIEILHIKRWIAPDQVPRLYSPKQIQKLDYDFMSLEEYIGKLTTRQV